VQKKDLAVIDTGLLFRRERQEKSGGIHEEIQADMPALKLLLDTSKLEGIDELPAP